jgi:excisionase family DNA binding protein
MPNHTAPPGIERALTIDQAADALGLSRSGLYRLLRSGELRAVTVGRRKRVRVCALNEYLEGNREGAP